MGWGILFLSRPEGEGRGNGTPGRPDRRGGACGPSSGAQLPGARDRLPGPRAGEGGPGLADDAPGDDAALPGRSRDRLDVALAPASYLGASGDPDTVPQPGGFPLLRRVLHPGEPAPGDGEYR